MSALSGVVSSVDKLVSEGRCELIGGEYRGSDFGAELFSEALGEGVTVVFLIVRDVHDGLTICITNTLEFRLCVSWCFWSN